MKPFTLKRFVLLPLIVLSLILTTGCHLLSHYSEEEVQQYISKNYPNLHITWSHKGTIHGKSPLISIPKYQLKCLKSCTPLHLLYHKLSEY